MSILFTQSEIARYYAIRFPNIQQNKRDEWRGKCPIHRGDGDNFAVDATNGMAYCHSQCNRGWDILSLEQEISGRTFLEAKKEVFALVGKPDEAQRETRDVQWGTLEKLYDYTDEHGTLLYQVARYGNPKKFKQRRPDGKGKWIWNLEGIRRVPYRLPALLAANTVFVVEGEKDADTLTGLGLTATCNSEGATHFRPELSEHFRGKCVTILPDNDDAGREHAQAVAQMLYGIAGSIKILELPGLPHKGDVTDFVVAGGTVADLRKIYSEAPLYRPPEKDEDRHVRTFRQEYELAGGMQNFWDMSLQKGIPTPFKKLTTALGGGLLNGEVYAIGAATGAGKTSLGLQFTITALRAGYGVLIYSMEMGPRQVLQRLCGIDAGVDLNLFRELQANGGDTGAMRRALAQSTGEFIDLPLAVNREPEVTPNYLLKESLRLKGILPKLDLIIVDHMQLMGSDGNPRTEYEKFTDISRALKRSAVELNIPVLVMSQVSRNAAHERRVELEMWDLRGSGAIEEDLAGGMLLYPDGEDVQHAKQQGRLEKGPVKSWLKLAKSRYGCSGLCLPLTHLKYCTRFDEYYGLEAMHDDHRIQ